MNTYEMKIKKLELEIGYLNKEYNICNNLFQSNKEYLNYRDTLLDKIYKNNVVLHEYEEYLCKQTRICQLLQKCYYYVNICKHY